MMKSVTDIVILIIATVWTITIVVSITDRHYQIPNTVQVAMGAVAAFLFGNRVLKGNDKK